MFRKLGVCLFAAMITGTSATYLASPAAAAAAANAVADCDYYELAYAQGYANAYCGVTNASSGEVIICVDSGPDFTFGFFC